MAKYCFLSHEIKDNMPEYGGEGVVLKHIANKAVSQGDSCNIINTELSSHLGTHIDCPRHFFDKAGVFTEYPAEFWIFNRPFLLNLNINEDEIIGKDVFSAVPDDTDIILIKTGFQKFRGQKKYGFNNPGISAEAAIWLREKKPKVRVVGIDFISISPYQDRNMGRQAHKAFLDPEGKNKPILILEDMDLKEANNKLSDVWVFPLRVSSWDSSPCTVIGIVKD